MDKLNPAAAGSRQPTMDAFDAVANSARYRATSAAGLAIGTSSTAAVKIVNTVTYLFAGAFKSKTTAEVAFTATVHDIPASATSVQEQVYAICLNGSGTPSIVAGGIATGAGNAKLPSVESVAGLTVIGTVRIAVAAGATSFTGGTTALSNGALTVTYTDLGWYGALFGAAQ